VATLCTDGEWRELPSGRGIDGAKPLRWFRWLRGNMCSVPGPNGTNVAIVDSLCKSAYFLVSGIDYDKPTVGPQASIPAGAPDQKRRK
jgi:hypothetical protein